MEVELEVVLLLLAEAEAMLVLGVGAIESTIEELGNKEEAVEEDTNGGGWIFWANGLKR